MSHRITIVMTCGALALGGAAAAGCGKDTSAGDLGSTTKTTTAPTHSSTTTPRKHTRPAGGRHRTSGASTTPATAPKPTKKAKPPKASVLKHATLVVLMRNNRFAPAHLRAKVGERITWRNDDPYRHNVTAIGGAGFKSGDVKARATYTFTPRKVGTINYVCTIHPGQRGRIDVIA